MVIDPKSVSFEAIKSDILSYIQSKPNGQMWIDKYAGGVGNTIIELCSGLAAYLQYSIAAARRESYLMYCVARSSAVAEGQFLGYSAYRGRNPVITLSVTPFETVFIPKLSVVGVYGSYYLITIQDTQLTGGVIQSINLVIGNIGTETIQVPSPDLQVFRFISSDISEDLILLITQVGASSSTTLAYQEILNPIAGFVYSQYYWVMSNAMGGIDCMYLNDPTAGYTQYAYNTGATIEVQYVELDTSGQIALKMGSIPQNLAFGDNIIAYINTYNDVPVYIWQPAIAPDTPDVIRVNAPLAHETQALIKGREDYEKLLGYTIEQVAGKSCACTNGIDNPNTPAIVYLSYIMSDQSLLSAFQKSQVLAILESYRPYGVQPPQLYDPTAMGWIASVTIYYSASLGITYTPYSVQADITAIFNQYTMQLGIMMGDQLARLLERQIDNLPYVEVSRVSFDPTTPTELLWNEYATLQQLTITTGT